MENTHKNVHDFVVSALSYVQQLVKAKEEHTPPCEKEENDLLKKVVHLLVKAEEASRKLTPMKSKRHKEKKKKKPACLSSLPSVCVISLLQYLDMLSLAEVCSSSKALYQDGTLVARCVWKHLVAVNLSSPFITLPVVAGQRADDNSLCAVCGEKAPLKCSKCKAVCYCSRVCQEAHWKRHDHRRACMQLQIKGGRAGQRSFAVATHDLFLRERHEVLLMGGLLGHKSYIESNEVTKMLIEQDANGTMSVRFEASTPMLEGRCMHSAIYHQGEVISVSPDTTECLDTMTQTRSLLDEQTPDDLRVRAMAVFHNKILLIGGKREVLGLWTHSDVVYELVKRTAHQAAAKGKWQKQEARLVYARSSMAAIAFDGKLFVCGGSLVHDEGNRSRTVEIFDPAVGAWRVDEEEMTTPRACFSLFIYEDEIYAVGGDDHDVTIEKRSKATKRWQRVASLGKSRELCHSLLLGSKVFLFGGFNNKTFDFFDLRTNKWASKNLGGAFFAEAKRILPHPFRLFKAVLITPAATAKAKTWTDLNFLDGLKRDDVKRK